MQQDREDEYPDDFRWIPDEDDWSDARWEYCPQLDGFYEVPWHLADTYLHRTLQLGGLRAAEELIREGIDVDTPGDGRDTPLVHAGDAKTASMLLRCGANPNPKSGRSPLAEAARHGDVKRIVVLLEAGANPNYKDSNGCTPMGWAIMTSHCDAVAALLQRGATDPGIIKKREFPHVHGDWTKLVVTLVKEVVDARREVDEWRAVPAKLQLAAIALAKESC